MVMDTFKRISVQEAHQIIETGDVTIVDIRDAASFSRGHITGAQSLNEDNVQTFMQKADKQIPLICYCYRGFSSQQAAGFFVGQGFKEVYSIDGGWEGWKAAYA
jgi:thiosulfate sulfurtransferase